MNIAPISFTAAGNAKMRGKLGPSHPFAYSEEPLRDTQADTFEHSAQIDSPFKTRVDKLKGEVAGLQEQLKLKEDSAGKLIFNKVVGCPGGDSPSNDELINEECGACVNFKAELYKKRKELLATALDYAYQEIGKEDSMLLSEGATAEDITIEKLTSAVTDYLTQKSVSTAERSGVAESTKKIQESIEQYCEGGIDNIAHEDVRKVIEKIIE